MSGDRQQALLGGGDSGRNFAAGAATVPDAQGEQPALIRYQTAAGAPWEHGDYSRDDLIQWLVNEGQQTKVLFENPLKPETHIPKSIGTRPATSLTFSNVSFSLKARDGTSKTILEPCHGHFEPGQLVAIMGPSGCGKSTLLDMLANKKTAAYEGKDEILVNGHPRDHLFQRIAAYVGQEDVMPQHWTVREAVDFNQQLKSPRLRNVPAEFRSKSVDLLLAAFGLSGVAETYIGGDKVRGISGGQRRRVTLARGVAQRASLLFADEPTSGLSATDAELCVKALRIIAKKFGVLTLVVIHQPRVEVANLFDQLVLLTATPGRMVYSGPMDEALNYWKGCGYPVPPYSNPTDVYLDLITPGGHMDRADQFVAFFQEKLFPGLKAEVDQKKTEKGLTVVAMLREQHEWQQSAQMGPPRIREKVLAVPFHQQVGVLLRRKGKITLRNPSAIVTPVLVPACVGVLLGVMYTGIGSKPFQQRLSFVFMLLVRICLGGMQLMPQLIEDRKIMKYDISEGLYSVPAFIVVGVSVDITLSLLGAILSCTIMYIFSGLSWQYFPMILTWAVLNFFVFDSFFACLAASAPNLQIAQVCAIPFNSIFMMFSGFMISKNSAPAYLRWLFEISPIGYAIQSIFCKMAEDEGVDGRLVIKLYGFEEGQDQKGITIMIAMAVVLRIWQVLSLKYRNNIQK
mmetsp:Transcript_23921/g.59615  ORF Transcript_23921/g.59615 Transcript_23921/m.59615 type:complete len:684 (+) Transcript_23921:76-2127(+)